MAATEEERAGVSRRDFLRGGAAALAAGGAASVLLEPAVASAKALQPLKPKKGGHLVEGWNTDIKTFNSVLTQDVYSDLMISMVNDGLLTVNAKGLLEPQLATAVPGGGSDGNTYTFKLRSGVKWSDGTPLTSDDVLFTYSLIWDPKYAAVASPRRGDFTAHVDKISAPDPQTFVIHTKSTYAPLLYSHGTYQIMPKHVLGSLAPADINTASYNSAPNVTCGAFKFVSWEQGSQVTVTRNENYWNGAPLLDQYIFKVLPSTVAIGNALKTGEVNAGGGLDPSQFASLKTVSDLRVQDFTVPSFAFIAPNLNPQKSQAGEFLKDVKVRQALYYAINRPAIIKSVLFGLAIPANSVEPPTSWAYDPNTTPKYPYDPAKAKKLLDEAGWKMGSNGFRSKNGVEMKLTYETETGSTTSSSIAQAVAQNWKAVGVNASVNLVEFTELVTELTETRQFDVIALGFNFTNDPDQSELFASSGTAQGGFNGMDFKNQQVDELLNKGTSVLNQKKRIAIYKQYQHVMAEQVPMIILYFQKALYGHLSNVHGMDLNAFQQYGRPWMNKVWIGSSSS